MFKGKKIKLPCPQCMRDDYTVITGPYTRQCNLCGFVWAEEKERAEETFID